jgi:hypothetical protein
LGSQPDEWTWELLDQYAVDIDDIDKGRASQALVHLLFYKVGGGEICVAAYARSTHSGSTR